MWSAYRSESSADTRYRNRSYGPPRPTEHDPPCRIRHRRPCHTSRPRIRWRAYACRRSTDIRHTLRGNARTGRESRPGHRAPAPPAGDSPFGDPNTACTERASGVDAGNSHLTPTGRPRPYICGAVYSLIEERYVLQEGQRAAVEEDRADFTLSPDPRYVTVRPACWSSRFLPRLKRV